MTNMNKYIHVLQLFFAATVVLQNDQNAVVSAFMVQPRPQANSASVSSSSLCSRAEEEEEFFRMKREKEAAQREWELKIQAKNEKKAQRRAGVPETSRKNAAPAAAAKPAAAAAKAKKKEDKADDDDASTCTHYVSKDAVTFAQAHSSELIALAGPAFDDCDSLGVGGLDEVVVEIKRRVWTPLAAPPRVMTELGITPVRGVLLWGSSGCGKTLLARTLGKLLSPARPLTVVSGPQLMDKFVGSSEKNLRELFDNPPPVYDPYRISGGKGMDTAALHVIVLDEFDAMARTRSSGSSDTNSEAGVARDSVVNQILSKMDGVDPLPVPTLVVAMTNRPSLIDPALLRPGRFEVQIEVPPPRTIAQRVAVLKVHMSKMQSAGRLLVRDAPLEGCVSPQAAASDAKMAYDELLEYLAGLCDGFSGASLAAVPRAAASRALERAVSQYSIDLNRRRGSANGSENQGKQDAIAMLDCVVSVEDLECAVQDVRRSAATSLLQEEEQRQPANSGTNGEHTNGSAPNGNTAGVPLNGNREMEVLAAANGAGTVY